jgi:cardiolipin synthase
MAEALVSAALRGVRVRLILPERNNQALTALASRSYWDELLQAGVAIYRYQPGMIHAKCIVVDGCWGSIGTANLDVRSFRLNFEVNALLYGQPEVRQLAAAFEKDLTQSKLIDAQQFRDRSVWVKAAEGGARLLSPIL